MRKKGDNYTRNELKDYEVHTDKFYQLWIDLHGRHGMTNYIHMLGSGHMYEYMVRWGNLTKYSQQGWEALNSLIKVFFFKRTNKGGHKSGGSTGLKSKLVPIARLIQRRLFWIGNLVPGELWNENYNFDEDTGPTSNLLSGDGEDIIFDTDSLVQV